MLIGYGDPRVQSGPSLVAIPHSLQKIVPVPRDEWPKWAKWISLAAKESDVGVGDTFHRELGMAGKAFEFTARVLGAPCRCPEKRADWNAAYPYG